MQKNFSAVALTLLLGSAGTLAAQELLNPEFQSNSSKYRVSQSEPARGRAGNASVELTALRYREASQVTVIASRIGETTPSGSLDQLQVKLFDARGKVRRTEVFRNVSGPVASLPLTDLVVGEPLQLQANVSGIDRRTGVVTVEGKVVLAPDLVVTGIDAPSSANVGSKVTLSATVAEVNGQLGANADCLLFADGVEVDRAGGIWVDAAGVVTCQFTTAFTSSGRKNLEVRVAGQAPADYDGENDSRQTIIDVVQPSTGEAVGPVRAWFLSAFEYDINDRFIADGWYTYPGTQDIRIDQGRTAWYQGRSFWATLDGTVSFPLTRLALRQTSQGVVLNDIDLASLAATTSWSNSWGSGKCASGYVNGTWFEVCSSSYTTGLASQTTVFAAAYAGEVTYHSEGFCNAENPNIYCSGIPQSTLQDGFWSWNITSTATYGSAPRLGDSFGVDLIVNDGGNVRGTSPLVRLNPNGYNYGWPYSCTSDSSWWASHEGGRYCTEASFIMSGRSGTLQSQ